MQNKLKILYLLAMKYIPLLTHHYDDCDNDNDYNDYSAPNASRVNEKTFQYLTLWKNKLAALCRHFIVTNDLYLLETNQFKLNKNSKTENIDLIFFEK